METSLKQIFSNITKQANKIKDFYPQYFTLHNYNNNIMSELIYHTNSIYGSDLNLAETQSILNGFIIDKYKLRDFRNVVNTNKVFELIFSVLKESNNKHMLTQDFISTLHKELYKNILQNAGKFRTEDTPPIVTFKTQPIEPHKIELQIGDFLERYRLGIFNSKNIIDKVARIHNAFVGIFPFSEGNTKTAMMLVNYELYKNNYPLISIKKVDKNRYFSSIKQDLATKSHEKVLEIILDEVIKENNRVLSYMEVIKKDVVKRSKPEKK